MLEFAVTRDFLSKYFERSQDAVVQKREKGNGAGPDHNSISEPNR